MEWRQSLPRQQRRRVRSLGNVGRVDDDAARLIDRISFRNVELSDAVAVRVHPLSPSFYFGITLAFQLNFVWLLGEHVNNTG